jgi:hypothetical protein
MLLAIIDETFVCFSGEGIHSSPSQTQLFQNFSKIKLKLPPFQNQVKRCIIMRLTNFFESKLEQQLSRPKISLKGSETFIELS